MAVFSQQCFGLNAHSEGVDVRKLNLQPYFKSIIVRQCEDLLLFSLISE